jgi:transcriptional regulator with XRE-family HTH domain
MPRQQGPAVARRRLAARLRAARTAAEMTQRDIAKALEWSTAKIMRIENAQSTLSKSDLLALLTQYPNMAEETVKELVEISEVARSSLANIESGPLDPLLAAWLQYEAYADRIRQYETKLIPGPLQIEQYSTALVQGLFPKGTKPDVLRAAVETRMARAVALACPDGPSMTFIMDEAAVRRGVGNERGERDYSVMIEQLHHLKHLNTLGRKALGESVEPDLNPNIGIYIVPFEFGAYQALKGPFELLEFTDGQDPNMVYLENPTQDIAIRELTDETAVYSDMFDEMEQTLPAVAGTGNLIDTVIQLMKEGRNGVPAGSQKAS